MAEGEQEMGLGSEGPKKKSYSNQWSKWPSQQSRTRPVWC